MSFWTLTTVGMILLLFFPGSSRLLVALRWVDVSLIRLDVLVVDTSTTFPLLAVKSPMPSPLVDVFLDSYYGWYDPFSFLPWVQSSPCRSQMVDVLVADTSTTFPLLAVKSVKKGPRHSSSSKKNWERILSKFIISTGFSDDDDTEF